MGSIKSTFATPLQRYDQFSDIGAYGSPILDQILIEFKETFQSMLESFFELNFEVEVRERVEVKERVKTKTLLVMICVD